MITLSSENGSSHGNISSISASVEELLASFSEIVDNIKKIESESSFLAKKLD